MREQVISTLNQLLSNNIGNRITPELATGILTTLNQALLQGHPQEPDPETLTE